VANDSTRRSSFTTTAQAAFRGNGWKRLLGAALLAILGLVALIIWGPDEQTIKKRFEYYGAPDEMRIMKEISIDDGHDEVEKLPKSLRIPPPPAKLEIEDDTPDPDGTIQMKENKEADPNKIDVNTRNPLDDAADSDKYQVEMSLPMQTSRDLFLLKKILPDYPLNVSEVERRTPVIVVRMNVFVDPDGNVSAVMIESSNGSKPFEEAAIAAVRQWKFGWRVAPGAGRWVQFPFNFKSPYFTPAHQP